MNVFRHSTIINVISISKRCLAAPAKGTAGGKLGGGMQKKGGGAQVVKKFDLPVETDTEKLAKFCCGLNILKTGGEEVPLKADSEYPDWLWKLYVEKPCGPPLSELEPDTWDWWIRKRNLARRHRNKMIRDEFPKPFIPKKILNARLA